MGATNSTPNFKFPLFTDTDKPTWRGDVNGISNKLESALDSVVNTSNSASTLATTALGQSNDAKTSAATANTTAGEAKASAAAANTTAGEAKASAAAAISTANDAKDIANTAKTSAESAVTTANGISGKVDTANATATDAKTKADAAVSTANNANAKAQSAIDAIVGSDTGWKKGGNSPTGVNWVEPPKYRIKNGVVYWRGIVAATFSTGTWVPVLQNIPAEALPAYNTPLTTSGGDTISWTATLTPSLNDIEIYGQSDGRKACRIGGSYPLT